ncbi:MAG: radical SAM protein [Anaerolineae bacterium]|nr:radical SAM protein [Anaerolineae bacterium]
MAGQLKEYLQDPFLNQMYSQIRQAGPLKSILVDITHVCNIRCQGCYFFAEEMDKNKAPRDEAEFDAFIEREKARGTNFVSVAGGEPSLMLNRVKKIYDNFWIMVVTNGLRRIPYEGFENMPIAVSVWGDHETDKVLRGSGKRDIFARGLQNYKDDPRVLWYYTTTTGNAHQIEAVVEECVANGNYVLFNFYGDLSHQGGNIDHQRGFEEVRRQINRMIERYPDRILLSSYISQVVSSGRLYNENWGYEVCCSLSADNEINRERLQNGKPYNLHFRAYNPNLTSTRRCCIGEARDCSTCYDVWAHFSWIMLNMKAHVNSKQEFTNWLTTMYLFYLINRIIDFEAGVKLLPQIHQRVSGDSIALEKFKMRLPLPQEQPALNW